MSESNQKNEAAAPTSTAIPLAPLPEHVASRVLQAGVKQVNLYRALAHAPRLLGAWIDFSWSLRERCETTRALRELIILRTAQLTHSQYEWHQHRRMAAEAGVEEHQVAELAMWPTSPAFDDAERADLAGHRTTQETQRYLPRDGDAKGGAPHDDKPRRNVWDAQRNMGWPREAKMSRASPLRWTGERSISARYQ